MLAKWEEWGQVIKNGRKYLTIRDKIPYSQCRHDTYIIFRLLMEAYIKVGLMHQLDFLCSELAQFLRKIFDNAQELKLVIKCLINCLRAERWRAGREVISKLINSEIKCRIQLNHINLISQFGYTVLILSVSKQTLVQKFLQWVNKLYHCHSYTHMVYYDILKWTIQYNKSQNHNREIRQKEYKDTQHIKFCEKLIQTEEAQWEQFKNREFRYSDKRISVILWQKPCSSIKINKDYVQSALEHRISTGELPQAFQSFQRMKNMYSSIFSSKVTEYYLRRFNTLVKLHLNDNCHMRLIPQLFQFWPYQMQQLEKLLMIEMNFPFQKVVQKSQHLNEDQKQSYSSEIKRRKSIHFQNRRKDFKFKPNEENNLSIKRVRKVYSHLSDYMLFTSNRRLKTVRILFNMLKIYSKMFISKSDLCEKRKFFYSFGVRSQADLKNLW